MGRSRTLNFRLKTNTLLKGTIGKSVIRIALPDNPLVAFLFGETGALKVTDTDLLELKALFTEG